MEEFKQFSELLKADERWDNFVLHNRFTNEIAPYTLEHRYQAVSRVVLSAAVPTDIVSDFNTAKMLGVYAWLYYPLHSVAELKAFSTVESALRTRFPDTKGGLNKLLTVAVAEGAITDSGFSHLGPDTSINNEYSNSLPRIIASLRNTHAHGDKLLHPGSLFTLQNCAEIINQLFPEKNPAT